MNTKSRTQNSIRNVFFGLFLKCYQTFLPFIMRTLLIYSLGIEYVGLNGLFTSVLQILNLAELGISQAMTYAMYKPAAENDEHKICQLLSLYKKYYFYIGLIVLSIGICVLPFIPNLISGEVPDNLNIYILYLCYLASTVISYWMYAYKNSLLEAFQRNDISSKIQMLILTIQSSLQILVLLFLKNYYLYIGIQVLSQVLNQIFLNVYTKRIYPNCYPIEYNDPTYERKITSNVKDLAIAKFGAVVLNSSDTVVISSFLGLSVLAIYQNYFLLISSIIGFVSTLMYGILSSIGNSIVTETKEKNYNDFLHLTFIITWITCVCTCCFLCLFQPFMKLWVGEEYMLGFHMVILLCIYYYIYEINQLLNVYKDAAGLWHKDRFRPLITSLSNLTMNIILVNIIGLEGVLLSTILSIFFIGMPWLIHNLFTTLFLENVKKYLITLFKYVFVALVSCVLSYKLCTLFELSIFLELGYRLIVAVCVPCILYIVCFYKSDGFKRFKGLILKVLKRRI